MDWTYGEKEEADVDINDTHVRGGGEKENRI